MSGLSAKMMVGLLTMPLLLFVGGCDLIPQEIQAALLARGDTVVVACPEFPETSDHVIDVLADRAAADPEFASWYIDLSQHMENTETCDGVDR